MAHRVDGELQPGDRVIDLRGLTRASAIFAGLAAAPTAARLADWAWGWCGLAAAVGAVAGFTIGGTVGRLVFPSSAGQAVVTRVGVASLGIALRASLCGGISVAVLFGLAVLIWGSVTAAGAVALIAIVVGAVMGCLAALL
jgi:hypothetical protein